MYYIITLWFKHFYFMAFWNIVLCFNNGERMACSRYRVYFICFYVFYAFFFFLCFMLTQHPIFLFKQKTIFYVFYFVPFMPRMFVDFGNKYIKKNVKLIFCNLVSDTIIMLNFYVFVLQYKDRKINWWITFCLCQHGKLCSRNY